MDRQMKMPIRVPIFDGEDFVFWKIRMKICMMSIGLEVWELVEEGYNFPKDTPKAVGERNKFCEHAKALNTLQYGISKKVLAKVLTYKSEKDI